MTRNQWMPFPGFGEADGEEPRFDPGLRLIHEFSSPPVRGRTLLVFHARRNGSRMVGQTGQARNATGRHSPQASS